MRERAILTCFKRVIVCGFLLVIPMLTGQTILAASDTTFYVVRHAEQAQGPTDVPLTAQGMRRAEELCLVLEDVPLSAVYATQTLRTFQTALPAAAAAGVEITTYDPPSLTPSWALQLKRKYAGQSVLIVSHSGMTERIVQLLGGTTVPPIDNAYDRLFVVTVHDSMAHTEQRRYHVLEIKGPPDLGLPRELKNVSAIAPGPRNQLLVAGDDEANSVQVLVRQSNGSYQAQAPIALASSETKELDIEAITRHGSAPVFYIIGSHSARRRTIFRPEDQGKSLGEIRQRFEKESKRDKDSERLIRLELNSQTGQLVERSLTTTSLRDLLASQPVLRGFVGAASKENGIDIEGLASDGQQLYVGFRGPVLRFGMTPVFVFEPDHPEQGRVRYVALHGLGIRDMARVDGGFLILAGPVGDRSRDYRLYHWDGNDCLPGQRSAGEAPQGRVTLLGRVPAPAGAAPEGLAVLDASTDSYELLIVYDGPPGGQPTRVRAARP